LVANGSRPALSLFAWAAGRAPRLIAVDGGLHVCIKYDLRPDLLIGDLDSVTAEELHWAKRHMVAIRERRSPQATDLEKAMFYCSGRKWKRLAILAASGDRPDHYLNGIDLAFKFRGLKPHFFMNKSWVIPLSGTAVSAHDLPAGHTVSWLGHPQAGGCTLEGVKWSFRGRTLSSGGFQSVSNVSRGPLRATQRRGRSMLVISLRPDQ